MQLWRGLAAGALAGGLLLISVGPIGAADRTTFAGCVTSRTDASVTLDTSGGELVTIDTTWLTGDARDTLTADCLTVMALTVDGRYVAESVEQGDEPNEVNSVTNETTANREQKRVKEDDDKRGSRRTN